MEKLSLIINQNATKVNFTLSVKAKNLYVIGWNFEEHIEELVESKGLSYIDAKISVMNRIVVLHFETNTSGDLDFFWYFATDEMKRFTNGFTGKISDELITIVSNNLHTFNSITDYSKDASESDCNFLSIDG